MWRDFEDGLRNARRSSGMSMVGGRAVAGVIEGAGDEAGGGGLADAAHAGEHVGLGDAAGGEGVGEGPHHRLLADQVGEGLRAGICGRGRDSRRALALLDASSVTSA